MNQRELERAIETELESWPDATVTFTTGGSHPKAKVMFGGKMLNVVYPGTPGDSARGVHNTLSDIRRALKKLGAVRAKPEPSKEEDEAPYRKPNDGREKRPDPVAREKVEQKPSITDQVVAVGLDAVEKFGSAAESVFGKGADLIEKAEAARDRVKGSTNILLARREDSEWTQDKPDADAIRAAFEARVAAIVDGIYFGLPADVYHAVPRLSSSGIQKICVSPANFWRGSWLDPDRPDPDEDETIWQVLGRAYHTARLEPHLFERTYVRELDKADMPKGTLFTATDMGKALEEFGLKKSGSVIEQAERLADAGFPTTQLWHIARAEWEEARQGRTPLPAKHYDQMITDRDRISANSQIAPLLQGGEAEVSIFWTDEYGVQMKARVDYLHREWWADFKTFDNSRGKHLRQALVDAVRYNRYYIQAPVYREAIEQIRMNGLQIIEAQTDDQRALVAALQMKPGELACWYIFQEKGGVPNLLAYEFPFYSVPYTRLFEAEAFAKDEERKKAVLAAQTSRTSLFIKGAGEVLQAKKLFVLYSQVYEPGEPWFPIEAVGTFSDEDFHPYWLEGSLV